MRKKIFNYLVRKSLEKFIVIAFFLALGSLQSLYATNYSYDAGVVPNVPPTVITPVWGKLVLSGNTVTCYYGLGMTTPKTWTQIGVPQTISFINNPILVGVYVTSHTTGAISESTIDNFSISPAPTYRLADYDIGAPALMGSANLINNVWNLSGSGADIWNGSDQCNFQSWLVWGDCTVICRVTSLDGGAASQKTGIMIRDGFNSGSDYALFCAMSSGVDFQYRRAFNNNADIIQFVAPPAPGVKSTVAVGYGLTGGTTYTLRP